MTASDLLEATRDRMGRTGGGISQALFQCWTTSEPRASVADWNDAARALVAYIDPYKENVSNCHLYGHICAFERSATFHTQIDAIDYAVNYLRKADDLLSGVIDPRD